nr:PREDICTED: high mobility group protein B1-like [Stegastes partitus]
MNGALDRVQGTEKKTVKISRRDTEDMLKKLDALAKKDDANPESSGEEPEKKPKNEEEDELEAEEHDEEENDDTESLF